MLQILLLLLGISAVLVLSYRYTGRDVLAPQICFSACFLPGVLYSLFFIGYWDLNYLPATVLVVILGCALFSVAAYATAYVLSKVTRKTASIIPYEINEETAFTVDAWKLYAFFAFEFATLIWLVVFLMMRYGHFDLLGAITYFNDCNKFTETVIHFPSVLAKCQNLCSAADYVWSYLLAYCLVHKRKPLWKLYALNLAGGFFISLVVGSRTHIVMTLLSWVVFVLYLYQRQSSYRVKLTWKHWIVFCCIIVVCLIGFKLFGTVIRKDSRNIFEYIGIYVSAPVKNLDIFISHNRFGADASHWQTFSSLTDFTSRHFGIPKVSYGVDLPFHEVNGHSLGNVATVFYAFLYDGGYWFAALMTVVGAALTRTCYWFCQVKQIRNIPFPLVVYGFMIGALFFSFFSGRFFEEIFSPVFVYNLIFWLLLKYYLENFSFQQWQRWIQMSLAYIRNRFRKAS